MPDSEIERALRRAGGQFIASHRKTETAIRAAADAGMVAETIAQVSGLSAETVDAFLRASAGK